jgi:hypothetical protein
LGGLGGVLNAARTAIPKRRPASVSVKSGFGGFDMSGSKQEATPVLLPFSFKKIAPEDKSLALNIQTNLYLLTEHLKDFKAAISLFEHATKLGAEHTAEKQLYSQWRFIAGRDGAVTIYNLGKTMEGIRASLHNCPSLNALVDQSLLTESTRILRQNFPRFEGIRHTIGHMAEFLRDNESRQEHGVGGVMIANSLFGRTFTATFEGKILGYEISAQSAGHLQLAVTTMLNAFKAACVNIPG